MISFFLGSTAIFLSVYIGSSLKEDQDFKETPFFSFMGVENPMPGMELKC